MAVVARLAVITVVLGLAATALWWSLSNPSPHDEVPLGRPRDVATEGLPPGTTAGARPLSTHATGSAEAPLSPEAAPMADPAVAAMPADPLAAAPVVPAQFAPQVASVVEAVRTGKHPERLSIAIDPAPFDATAYARDPQAYLSVVEPARVYQTAPAGPAAVPLRATVDHVIPVPALGSTELAVIGQPHAPVTFTVLDGGRMPNSLASITVQADAEGRASTTYTATPGTVDEVQILVGSPMTVGTLTLRVAVAYPEAPAVSVR
jgi:hypothetical protein